MKKLEQKRSLSVSALSLLRHHPGRASVGITTVVVALVWWLADLRWWHLPAVILNGVLLIPIIYIVITNDE